VPPPVPAPGCPRVSGGGGIGAAQASLGVQRGLGALGLWGGSERHQGSHISGGSRAGAMGAAARAWGHGVGVGGRPLPGARHLQCSTRMPQAPGAVWGSVGQRGAAWGRAGPRCGRAVLGTGGRQGCAQGARAGGLSRVLQTAVGRAEAPQPFWGGAELCVWGSRLQFASSSL